MKFVDEPDEGSSPSPKNVRLGTKGIIKLDPSKFIDSQPSIDAATATTDEDNKSAPKQKSKSGISVPWD